MKYIEDALDLKVGYSEWEGYKDLPYLITNRYHFRIARIEGLEILFIYPQGDIANVSVLARHVELIRRLWHQNIAIILERCTERYRKALVEHRIPFVVDSKQIYLPFLGVVFQESFAKASSHSAEEYLLPSAQLIFFYFIYSMKQELAMNGISTALGISAMSVSRAVKQLSDKGLLCTHKDGVSVIISSNCSGQKLYEKAEGVLRSPVRKVVYVEKNTFENSAPLAGLTALSEYSMLNPPSMHTYAVEHMDKSVKADSELTDSQTQYCIELWSYDPSVLAGNGCVDLLSLHQSLKSDTDERIQGELEELLKNFWEDYENGKRLG